MPQSALRRPYSTGAGWWVVSLSLLGINQALPAPLIGPRGQMELKRGQVNYTKPPGAPVRAAEPQPLDLRDRLDVGERSWAIVRFRDASEIKVRELTQIEIVEPTAVARRESFRLLRGEVFFSGLRRAREFQVEVAEHRIVPNGTEFLIRVSGAETEVFMFHGEAVLENSRGRVVVRSGEQGVIAPGQPPRLRAAIEAKNVVQWWLYYPAVLDLQELPFTPAEQATLDMSLTAYRSGDLTAALSSYPGFPNPLPPASDALKIYYAELLLSVGSVQQAEDLLQTLDRAEPEPPAANALRRLILAVTRQESVMPSSPASASQWLAASYQQQSNHQLQEALASARKATELSPSFALAWQQVAELEFGFGRTRPALRALERVLHLAPRHAQAHALRGFVLSAENRIDQALAAFETAISIDPALGNARLGRGLCRIRQRQFTAGLEDLQLAILLEPNRALLHSYLGKAYEQAGEITQAHKEFDAARQLDPNDPTPWLYRALAAQEQNRINPAVRDLEMSQQLNDNRRVYRSRLLLDQDRAARSAHLAAIYQDAGLEQVSLHEASRSLAADYANYSAHLFLADSYNALRDPRQVNLRYETPWLSEYLVANLLSPVSAGSLAPGITPNEYSRLFDQDGFGLSSLTEYRSSGDWLQAASQYGRSGNSAYAVDLTYTTENGYRPNNDFEQLTGSLRLKHQLTPQDGLYFQVLAYGAEGGDLRQYYDPADAQRQLRFEEHQEPLLVAGYHHEWGPSSHTLFLASRWDDTFKVQDPQQDVFLQILSDDASETVWDILSSQASMDYRSELQGYSLELQQIQKVAAHTFVAGARFQFADFSTSYRFSTSSFPATPTVPSEPGYFVPATMANDVETRMERRSVYAYDYWQVGPPLILTAGLSYDWLEFPANHRSPPVSDAEETTEQLSPKAGLVFLPWTNTTVRGAYARSLGGVSFDRSFQLEPAQVAGFTQTYRSLTPESVVGSLAGAEHELFGLGLDQRVTRNTYLTVTGERLHEEVSRDLGVFAFSFLNPGAGSVVANSVQRLDFVEKTLGATLHHLYGDQWMFGAGYRWSEAELETRLPGVQATVSPLAHENFEATLHRVNLFVRFDDPSGFFGLFDSVWSQQSNRGYVPDQPGDDFWQFNVYAGYRFARRRVEVKLGLLNLTDQDYRLNPLNLSQDLPHERTFMVSLRFSL